MGAGTTAASTDARVDGRDRGCDAALLLLPLGGVVGVLARRRVDDAAFRACYRWVTALISVVRGFLTGWVFRGSPTALATSALVAATELLRSRLLVAVTGGPEGPVAGFAAHSNTTYWSLPAAAVLVGDVGVAPVTLYEMATAPRVGPAIRRMQTGAAVPSRPWCARCRSQPRPRRRRRRDHRCLCRSAHVGGPRPPPARRPRRCARRAVPRAVAARRPASVALRAAAKVVAVRAVVLPLPLVVAVVAGLHVPLAVWLLATGLAPFNTVVLAASTGTRPSSRERSCCCPLSDGLCLGVLAAR
ncbi:MAG: hypothetical protein M3P37_06985 [Actinomycetota bacterium]|nr:hypothetical protein [Actinomycetota bacterium]